MTVPDSAAPLSEELLDLAHRIRAAMDGWVTRMAGAAGAGRSATSVARMATARAISEMRSFAPPAAAGDAESAVADYLRRSRSLLTQAAHEIERNRYSLQLMDTQLQRLEGLMKRIFPEDFQTSIDGDDETAGGSAGAAGSADDRGSDRKSPTG